jgi:hypothetical protein
MTQIIKGMGFTINPYHECVAMKKINNSTRIVNHIACRQSQNYTHKDRGIVSDVIKKLSMVFGKEAPLSINRDKCHR